MTVDIKALQVLDKIFKKHDITYWLDYGTLLGAVREGKPIEWDWDIDVSIFFKDLLRAHFLEKEFQKYGYSFKRYRIKGLPAPGISKDNKHLICILSVKIKNGYLITVHVRRFVIKLVSFMHRNIKCPHFRNNFIHLFLLLVSILLNDKKRRWAEYKWLGNFAYVEMYGDYYPIPEHVEKYLNYRYSTDWRVPIKGKAWREKEKSIILSR